MKLYVKLNKCEFFKPEVKFLGHVVGQEGVKVDPAKVAVVTNWPDLRSQADARAFLGLANYFRKFIRGYSATVAPLVKLTRADAKWEWLDEQKRAFEAVKLALSSAPVLVIPDLNKPFTVISDASTIASGAVLLQEDRVVAYTSKMFTPAEYNYATGEQELLGVIHALKEWRCYLEGVPDVTLVTDRHPNTHLPNPGTQLSRRQSRWVEFLSRFHYTWKAIPGRTNVADPITRQYFKNQEERVDGSLKRNRADPLGLGYCSAPAFTRGRTTPPPGTAKATQERSGRDNPTSIPSNQFADAIRAAYASDPWYAEGRNLKTLRAADGLYYRGTRVAVPRSTALRDQILYEAHNTPLSGHVGVKRTLARVCQLFWWKRMYADVQEYVDSCGSCQRNKVPALKPGGTLQPLPIPSRRWGSVSTDFITGLPKTRHGYDAIVVFVCRLLKMVHFAATTTDVDAAEFVKLFMDNIIRLHGVPNDIVSDRGSVFTSAYWTEVCKRLDITRKLSTSFHPQTDGKQNAQIE